MATLGRSDLDVFPLCLGGNVFGWTADEASSFAVLDAYVAAGGNFIDTADVYSAWVPGNSGGESETIIGRWMAARSNRTSVVIATKVGHNRDLRRQAILEGAERSLERLATDHIDLYYAHNDDPETPFEESLGAFGELVREGKVRYIAASNFTAERLSEALAVSAREGLPAFVALQNEYHLLDRGYEGDTRRLVASAGLAAVPYRGLAGGFLSGKYRPGSEAVDSPRATATAALLDERGLAVLAALDTVAAAHDTTQSAVALAWLRAQPTVVSPIASARSVAQLDEWLGAAALTLSSSELEALSRAG
jgi:aryl-alcohol dehydrogenase-like predicted oxidoreductase